MSKGPQDGTELPAGWWNRFRDQIQSLGFGSLEGFCERSPTISIKTLRRARRDQWMTEQTVWRVAQKLQFPNQSALLAEWASGASTAASGKLGPDESEDLQSRYVAFARNGLWQDARALSLDVLGRTADDRSRANWADLVADACRSAGSLREAAKYYALAWSATQEALGVSPDDIHLRYQAGRIRFGQIIVQDCLLEASFEHALTLQTKLLADVEQLIADDASAPIRGELAVRRIHIKRQQAEMERMLGRYTLALGHMRDVIREYPAFELEPICYARLGEGDSLRQLPNHAEAWPIYDELEGLARGRQLSGLLSAILWRKACLARLAHDEDAAQPALRELRQIAERRAHHKLTAIYYQLASASGCGALPHDGLQGLDTAVSLGGLARNHMALEYAHSMLCRAEIYRQLEDDMAARCFRSAYEAYSAMPCPWGVVRSWIGLKLCGWARQEELSPAMVSSLQGTDADLLSRYQRGERFEVGRLSVNLL